MAELEGPLKRGRPGLDLTIVKVGLDDEALRFVDERRGDDGRATFIRDLVKRAISGGPAVPENEVYAAPEVKKIIPRASGYEPRGDEKKLLEALRTMGPMTDRDVMKMWGWSHMRANGAAMLLQKHRLIHYPAGLGVMHAVSA